MFEKLFESLDEKVFTTDLKESLEASFNEAVETKLTEATASKIAELEELHEAKITELDEKAEAFIESQKEELLESVDEYLERVVEDFITESEDSLKENLVSEKAELVIEAHKASCLAAGVTAEAITEAKDSSEAESKLVEATEKYDALVEENIELNKTNKTLLQAGIIAEMKEGLSLVESEKFEKIAETVEFTKDEAYAEKLETLKESVKGAVVKEEVLDESVVVKKSAFAHLI